MDLLNLCLPLNTDTTSPKLERASLTAMIANELRKEDGHKDRFSPISERTNSFPEIKTDFWIAKTALDLCTLKFLLRRLWSKDQNKLWRRNFVQSTYLWLPKIPEYGKYPILESFFGPPLSTLSGQAKIFFNLSRMWLHQRLVPVRELFKPAEFGSRYSSGTRAQSSPEGIKLNRVRIKLNIPFYRWVLINHIIWIVWRLIYSMFCSS